MPLCTRWAAALSVNGLSATRNAGVPCADLSPIRRSNDQPTELQPPTRLVTTRLLFKRMFEGAKGVGGAIQGIWAMPCESSISLKFWNCESRCELESMEVGAPVRQAAPAWQEVFRDLLR
jgi:hypothetical protein